MERIKRFAPIAARLALGVPFLIFGLNGFLNFLPMPPYPPEAGSFLGALAATGYMFPLIKGTEVLAGAALLLNRYVPLALTLLAPVVVNIVAFHLALAPGGLALPVFLLVALLVAAYLYRDAFAPMLRREVSPEPGEPRTRAFSPSASRA